MVEKALYNKLEQYNGTIDDSFRNNWGSLLTYLDSSDDTNLLCKTSNKVRFEEQSGANNNNMAMPSIIM